jgi:hypothetical protein
VLLAQNPSSVRELSNQERRLLTQLAATGRPELLLQWSRWRIEGRIHAHADHHKQTPDPDRRHR